MLSFTLMQKCITSLLLGALIGIEREKVKQRYKRVYFAGIRTYMIVTFLGTLSAYVSDNFFDWFLAVVLVMYSLTILASYITNCYITKHIGITSEISALVAFVIGVVSYTGPFELAVLSAVVITLTLSFSTPLHKFASQIKRQEFIDMIKFLIIAFVILPLLPNHSYGPYGFFNPYEIWLMVVFVSAVNFGSYILIKFFGAEKGIGLIGFFGGFLSSMAVVSSMAQKSKQEQKSLDPYIFAAAIASSTMFLRVILEVFLLNSALLYKLVFPLVCMTFVGYVPLTFMWKKLSHSSAEMKIENPLNLNAALKFGVFYAVILFISKAGQLFMGSKGIYLASIISGIADIDAITIFVARQGQNILTEVAVMAIVIGATVNTVAKIFIGYLFGSKKFAKNLSLILGVTILLGLLFISHLFGA
ncbi:DUF4010 domain-containing protein [Candidatus Woesearchaeota archaeon]|nr:DUF4010 domain-containing protein [Candidatus Woesearchaeota archaeon]